MTIGRLEHPIHVHVIGGSFGLWDYFSPPQRSNESLS